jgi:mannose-1-phosphate guanylyltransferase/mannose-6-phosphate isomerase
VSVTTSVSDNERPLIPVIISGGAGTRLWPLSRESKPKQFLPLLGPRSLFQQTLLRARAVGQGVQAPIVVCNVAHRELVLSQSQEVGVEPQLVVLEPVGRNTAPAVAVAALLAVRARASADVDPLLLVLPADHVITDDAAFAGAVQVAIDAARAGKLVTFGIEPDRPETGYGYIRRGEQGGPWVDIERFVEKPDRTRAEEYIASGAYWWNSGMFLFSAAQLIDELRSHAPEILTACSRLVALARRDGGVVQLGLELAQCPSSSIDYAVMEKTEHGAAVPLASGWSDVGSWAALHDASEHDAAGNAAVGHVVLNECANTYVYGGRRLIAAIGLDNVIIVESDDAVLVLHRDRAQDVKKIVDTLKHLTASET